LDAQTPESFFPHHVGDRWDSWHSAYGHISRLLTRDSVSNNDSHILFYDNSSFPELEIDTAHRVFHSPTFPQRFLLYRLDADSGDVWAGGPYRWAWMAGIYTDVVFSRSVSVKIFRYGVQHPDSGGWNRHFQEHHLASGFGLVYQYSEPSWIQTLLGCIIAGDTFGILTTGIRSLGEPVARKCELAQNYPNPFNPQTTIQFYLEKRAHVALKIYDALGQHITTLIDGEVERGNHRLIWNGSSNPAGVYFARLQGGVSSNTIKMLLIP
jgi:hypothetical protein